MPRPRVRRNGDLRPRGVRMRLIERYLLRQLLGPVLLAAGALTGVALLSQALNGFEIIVEQGQSALVFGQIVLFSLPRLTVMILPIAVFVGALIALNRLQTEHEIVVCFAGGMSRWRVIAPAMRLAVAAALLILLVNLFIQPVAARVVRDLLFTARTDLAATLLREGQFTHPAKGLTVYVQQSEANGRLTNIIINERKADGTDSTISAAEGRMLRQDGKPVLLMRNGTNQELNNRGVLNLLAFDEYLFDLSPYVNTTESVFYKISDRFLHELVFPDLRHDWERHNRTEMLAEANFRVASSLYPIALMLIALAAVIGGSFSRVGYGRRIAIASGAAAVTLILGFGAPAAAEEAAPLNLVQYLIPLGAAYAAWRLLFRSPVASRDLGRGYDEAGLQPLGPEPRPA